jgi:hypothetical protein
VSKWVSSMLWALPAVCLLSPDAGAATVKIRPDQFQPSSESVTPFSRVGPQKVWAIVNLPAGKTIKKLTFYACNGTGGTSEVTLARAKLGAAPEGLANAVWDTENYPQIETVTTTDITHPVIEAGYTYFILVEMGNDRSNFLGAQVTYQ